MGEKNIGFEELIKIKKELEADITKLIEKKIRVFYDNTGICVKTVIVSVNDTSDINYVKCELSLD